MVTVVEEHKACCKEDLTLSAPVGSQALFLACFAVVSRAFKTRRIWSDRTLSHNKQVPGVALVQIFLGLGALELKMHGGKIGRNDMFDGDRAPGDFGFDPMGLGKKDISTLKLKEIKNGRLAMLAFSGIMHQQIISKVPTMVFGGPWGQTPTPFVISPLN
jgi:hypothetical protein